MTAQERNIVQAEFFHVEASSLEKLVEECVERSKSRLELALEGVRGGNLAFALEEITGSSGIKMVIRFFDEADAITKLALKSEELRKLDEQLINALVHATGLQQWFLNFRSRRLARKILKLKDITRALAVDQLRRAVQSSQDIAVECYDRSFRLARKDEMHELVESAARSTGVWLFIFKPNNLLADKNKPISCAM